MKKKRPVSIMPNLKYTQRKTGGRDSEATGPGGTGVLGATVRRGGRGSGGPEPEEEEEGGSVVVGGSSEVSGNQMSGAMGSGVTGNPDTHGPRPEASTGGTGTTVKTSEDEMADICSGLQRKAKVSRSRVNCPEAGCGRLFTRMDNADRHCVRFHGVHLDGTPASAAEVAKLTSQVKDSDRRRLEAKKLASASSGVGPVVKARRIGEHSEKRSISAPPAVPKIGDSDDSDTDTEDRSARCDSPDVPDPSPLITRS